MTPARESGRGVGRRRRLWILAAVALVVAIALVVVCLEERARRERAEGIRAGTPDRIEFIYLEETDPGWLSLSILLRDAERSVAVENAVLSVHLHSWDGARAGDEIAHFQTRVGAVHFCRSRGEIRLAFDFPCHLAPLPAGTRGVEARVKLDPPGGTALEGTTRFVPVALVARETH